MKPSQFAAGNMRIILASSKARKMSTLFTDAHQASNYALYRPDYPDELFEKVYDYSLHTGVKGIVFDNVITIFEYKQ